MENEFHITVGKQLILPPNSERDSIKALATAVGGRFILNGMGMIRRLATLDFGIAVLSEELAADDVAAGLLRRVMPECQGRPKGSWGNEGLTAQLSRLVSKVPAANRR
jgi:DNA-binding transcriptional LysR family regulator